METSTFEFGEMFEENGHKRRDILRSFLRGGLSASVKKECSYAVYGSTDNRLSIVSVGESDADGLINEKHICLVVPRLLVELGTISVKYAARTQFHEKTKGGGTART